MDIKKVLVYVLTVLAGLLLLLISVENATAGAAAYTQRLLGGIIVVVGFYKATQEINREKKDI